ncbi:MAG: LON peptidase substrate-binding domain-containing protein [Anaerolineae bacterium]
MKELPLFPLNTVLFPGMVLPLHIFEPRYRLMINRCIRYNQPFGVVLIHHGVEVGGEAVPHPIGTSAYVTHVERLPDGRMDIHAVGYQRFKIHELRRDRPYLVGLVEDIPIESGETLETARLAKEIGAALRRYLETFTGAVGASFPLDNLPSESVGLAYLTAIALPLPLEEKQHLLTIDDLVTLLRTEQVILRRERLLLDLMIRRKEAHPEDDDPLNLTSPN